MTAEVEVRRVGQLEPDDLLDVPEGDACLIVDALVGVAPGQIVCGSLASLLGDAEAGRGRTSGNPRGEVDGSAGGTRAGNSGQTVADSSGWVAANSNRKTTGAISGKTIALGSSHSIAPAEVLGLVRELRGELPAGGYVGVGAASFELGASVSEPVADAVPALAAAIVREVRELIRPDTPTT